jgi:hypothetical protein
MNTSKEGKYRRALEFHEDRLSRLPNVVGLGITEDPRRSKKGRPALAVGIYVSRLVPRAELRADEVIPKRLTIGKGTYRWVHTYVIESGSFQAEEKEDGSREEGQEGKALDEEGFRTERFSKERL